MCNVLRLTENFKHLFKVFLASWLHTNTFKCPSAVLLKEIKIVTSTCYFPSHINWGPIMLSK